MLSLKVKSLTWHTAWFVLMTLICAAGARSASGQIATSMTLSLTMTNVFEGQTPVANVTVTAADGSTPDGSDHQAVTCTIHARGHAAAYASSLQNGSASLPLTSITRDPVGEYGVECFYEGSGNYAASAAPEVDLYVIACSVWSANSDTTLSRLDCATGSVQATQGTSGPAATAAGVAIDSQGAAWAVNNTANSVVYLNPGTKPYSTAANGTISGAGLAQPAAVAIDGADQVWIANGGNSVSAFTNTGAALSPTTGYGAATAAVSTPYSAPSGIAVDQTGSVWVTNSGSNTVTRIFGSAVPAIVPIVTNVTNTAEARR